MELAAWTDASEAAAAQMQSGSLQTAKNYQLISSYIQLEISDCLWWKNIAQSWFYFLPFMCSSEVCSSLEEWIWRSQVAVSSVRFCSLCVLSRSGLGEQRAGVGWVRGGLAPDLQRFPQLHLLLLDKPQLSQEVPPGAAEAGAGPLPRPGPLNGRFQGALRVRVCGQQQRDPRALLQRVLHLHPGDADVAEDLLWRVEGMLVTYRSVKAYLEYDSKHSVQYTLLRL